MVKVTPENGHIRSRWSRGVRWARLAILPAALFATVAVSHASDPFVASSPEELAMKSQPGYPGVAAVVLFQEEIDNGDQHTVEIYERIKVLTDEGKKYANVELPYMSVSMFSDFSELTTSVDKIFARTIHADGTIVPFTGKPYVATVEKVKGVKLQTKVFTLADVQVGSVLEFRYTLHLQQYNPPVWYVQGELFVKSAHYLWKPTHQMLFGGNGVVNSISSFVTLPPGASVVANKNKSIELTLSDIPPLPDLDYMPPSMSYAFRVLFTYSHYKTQEDFWKTEGAEWSKAEDLFMTPNRGFKSAVATIVAGATTPEEKLKRLYAAVMAMDNTSFTREKDRKEEKAAGLKVINTVDDLWTNKRGDAYQLTKVFVAMARTAGFSSYLMCVPDRSQDLFAPAWWNTRQFDHLLAIVVVDGKEKFFDPGSPRVPFGQVDWRYTYVNGMRQTAAGSSLDHAGGAEFKDNQVARVANLTIDAKGGVTGRIDLAFHGSPALRWRQEALVGDAQSIRKDLKDALAAMLPKSMAVEVLSIENMDDPESPLKVAYSVTGTLGSAMGKRLVVPVDLFAAGDTPTFQSPKRDLSVYFAYPQWVEDALRIRFPDGMRVEAIPANMDHTISHVGIYKLTTVGADGSFTTRRSFVWSNLLVLPDHYQELRDFYSTFEANDQQSVVLKMGS